MAAPLRIRRVVGDHAPAVRLDSTIAPMTRSSEVSGAASVSVRPKTARARVAIRSATRCVATARPLPAPTPRPAAERLSDERWETDGGHLTDPAKQDPSKEPR